MSHRVSFDYFRVSIYFPGVCFLCSSSIIGGL